MSCLVVGVPHPHDKAVDDGCRKDPHFKEQEEKKKDRKKNVVPSKIFVSKNETKQSVFIQVASFHCKFNCTVLIFLGFVDIMSFYFQPELNGVMLLALLCVYSQKIKKRRARLV